MVKISDIARSECGDTTSFDTAWRALPAGERYHFRRGRAKNQVQSAFQNHWRVFQEIMGHDFLPSASKGSARRVLEAGCGRGSMAAFFADSGFDTFLLDFSTSALETARRNFDHDDLRGAYICGDALDFPFDSSCFDVVVSIGLLEHFSDIRRGVEEQLRVLKPGGFFLGYVVPERPASVQRLGDPINKLLAFFHRCFTQKNSASWTKSPLFRNEFSSVDYFQILKDAGCQEYGALGMFPVPLISHSPDFPFSPMGPVLERILGIVWRMVMAVRRMLFSHDPWICDEKTGLAFLVWCKKPDEVVL